MEVKEYAALEEIAEATAALLKGPNIALSGGDTYARLFGLWAPLLRNLRNQSDAKTLRFFPVDERRVDFDEPGNNWKIAYDKLFVPAGIPEQKDHMAVFGPQYQQLLQEKLGAEILFDQIFLGMGDDGHTASLFPGGAYLQDTQSLVLETESPKPPHPRVTLALKPIWSCRTLVAVILGAGKAPMVRRLLAGDKSLPITLALEGHPHPILILDRAAAGKE